MEGEVSMSLNKRLLHLAPVFLVLIPFLASTQGTSQSTTQAVPTSATTKAPKNTAVHAKEDEGSRIFAQNCARCHNAPDGFSPHISGTVVRHMRVRASLSKHDEEELMRFFNP